jgi:hypothetical protein
MRSSEITSTFTWAPRRSWRQQVHAPFINSAPVSGLIECSADHQPAETLGPAPIPRLGPFVSAVILFVRPQATAATRCCRLGECPRSAGWGEPGPHPSLDL